MSSPAGMGPPFAVAYSAIFVSPHFDDVALSCGGTVALEARDGPVLIVTVFGGEPRGALNAFAEFQHRRWRVEDAVDERRREDRRACRILGADHLWLDYLDAIYRDGQYLSDDDLFGPAKPGDAPMAERLVPDLVSLVARHRPARVYLPVTAGGHVDHRICRASSRQLRVLDAEVRYYEDFPYAALPGTVEAALEGLDAPFRSLEVEIGEVLEQKVAAIAAYASQLATIFRHFGPYDTVTRTFAASRSLTGGYAERFWLPANLSETLTSLAPTEE